MEMKGCRTNQKNRLDRWERAEGVVKILLEWGCLPQQGRHSFGVLVEHHSLVSPTMGVREW